MKKINSYILEKLNVKKISMPSTESIYWFTNNMGIILPFSLTICGTPPIIVDITKIIKSNKFYNNKFYNKWEFYNDENKCVLSLSKEMIDRLFFMNRHTIITDILCDKIHDKRIYHNSVVIKYKDDSSKILEENLNEKLNVKNANIYRYTPKTKEELAKYIFRILDSKKNDSDEIDLSYIDVSNLDSLAFLFNKFTLMLPSKIDVTGWKTQNIIYMKSLFADCKYLKEIKGLDTWDVSNVKDMSFMFKDDQNLKSVGDISNWNITRDMKTSGMFSGCIKLNTIGNIDHWRHDDLLCNIYEPNIKPQPKKLP